VNVPLEAQIDLAPREPAMACALVVTSIFQSIDGSRPRPFISSRIKRAVENVERVANKGELTLRQLDS
jgi:hypothetical protein